MSIQEQTRGLYKKCWSEFFLLTQMKHGRYLLVRDRPKKQGAVDTLKTLNIPWVQKSKASAQQS